MTTPVWPVSLPTWVLLDGYQESPPATRIRTEMDSGVPKMRNRYSASVRPVTFSTLLTASQVATFDTFYVTTLAGGTLEFEWTNPRTTATVNFRFAAAPVYRQVNLDLYEIRLELEQMP